MTADAKLAVAKIQQLKPGFTPKAAVVLGSGLATLAESLTDATVIPYEDLPGFPPCTVLGHVSQLWLGYLNGVPVACLQGRVHYYEGINYDAIKTMIRTMKLLGAETLLSTNASGSMQVAAGPGELMMITDHINFQAANPLLGPNDEEYGERFFPMDNAYDKGLQQLLATTAEELNIALHKGIYIGVLGPNFETPAEIRMFKQWGADAVGMSTVPEVLVANHCGMRVAVVAAISNYAAGMQDESLNHAETLKYAEKAVVKLAELFLQAIPKL